uniref:Ring finger protein 207a n=1 Tax=Cyprinus carpio carpio TaxID=630221 RepID=A0A9J8DBV4_CYPCA
SSALIYTGFCALDYASLHPLVCHLCHEQYHQPCLLDCHHIICASCLCSRANDNRINCPLCGYPSVMKGTNALPPEDRLIKFLVDNLTDSVVQCANCDVECKLGAMYYCTKEGHPTHALRCLGPTMHLVLTCYALKVVKELQLSTREAIILLKAMLSEVMTNAEEEESAICTLFNSMQQLMDRLCSIVNPFIGFVLYRVVTVVQISEIDKDLSNLKINTDYRAFTQCVKPLLMLGQLRPGSVTAGLALSNSLVILVSHLSYNRLSPLPKLCLSPSVSEMPFGRRPTFHRNICTKMLLAEGRESPFTEHCRNFEKSYRFLQTEVQRLKDEVQEMHKDLTKHHSLINTDTMDEILERSLFIDEQIASQYSAVQTQRAVFEEMWDVTFQRVTNEQEIYEAQLHDLLQLKQENSYLTTIARQIGPYILSIAKVKERLEPRLFCNVDEFVSSSKQICRNLALHHLLTNGSSAVNGCRQNESPNS